MAIGKNALQGPSSFESRRREGMVQRREPRYSVPLDGVGVNGEVFSRNGGQWAIRLWDISRHGACLVLKGRLHAMRGILARLLLHDNLGQEHLWFDIRVCWSDLDMGRTFIGVEFVNNAELPQNTFLDAYFTEDWTENNPRIMESMKDLGTL